MTKHLLIRKKEKENNICIILSIIFGLLLIFVPSQQTCIQMLIADNITYERLETAGSSIEVVNVLREAGCNVLGIVSIFTYNLKKGIDRLAEANVISFEGKCITLLK